MRGLVIVLTILALIASFSFTVVNSSASNKETKASEPAKNFEFSTFTSAVCENVEKVVKCKDEVFVNCDGKISKAIDAAECNGVRLDVPKATGSAVFGSDWKDPRQLQSQLTP